MIRGPEAAVLSSVPAVAWLGQSGDAIVSLTLGLAGVILARWVFVDRENRKIGRRQTVRETLPLTLVAMLISGVLIWDNGFGFSKAALTGLGVGWTAVVLLDVIGRRLIDPGPTRSTGDPVGLHLPPAPTPEASFEDLLRQIDEKTKKPE